MVKTRILVVEDDSDIIDIIQFNLSREGYQVEIAKDGPSGVKKALQTPPKVILLDLMLPEMDGLDVCRRLREETATRNIPIIMLTAKSEESDIVVGLNLGADDYVTKPFSPKVLLARIKALLRRSQLTAAREDRTHLEIDNLIINVTKYEVTLDGVPLSLTRSEFRLLHTLASNPGRVFTRDQLLDRVSGEDVIIVERNIDVHVASLRKKIKRYSDHIITIRGVGYRFKEL